MFINMGLVSPRPGKEKVLAAVMHSFAEAFEGPPGLQNTYVVIESDGMTIAGISVWEDKGSFLKRP
jgi:heme-degrading monooxygenase HmoA